jgi:hypothetical protein
MAKLDLSLSFWMHHCVFFNMMWRVMAYGRWIVANGLFLSFSCQIKYMIVLFVFGFSISVFILLIFDFVFIPFIKVFFQFCP